MAVWRELIFGKRETSKLHLSLMIYQIQYHKSETRGSGHLFICWSSKTTSLSFLCPLTEIKALSFVGWIPWVIGGITEGHAGSLVYQPDRWLPPLTACGMLTKMNGALITASLALGMRQGIVRMPYAKNFREAEFSVFFLFFPQYLS